MRVAIVSPYSWTYPGGVTRHIEALSGELARAGHEVRVLAPFDPDDRLSRRLHRGAAPEARDMPDHLIALGRSVGVTANGAVSNLSVAPSAIAALRHELRTGGYDVVHLHEPVAPLVCWKALGGVDLPLVGTFHAYSVNALTNGAGVMLGARQRLNRLHVRIAVSDAAAWTARRFFGGRYRIVPNGVDLQAPSDRVPGHGRRSRDGPLRIVFVGQAVERKGLPVLLRAFEALREQLPVQLTLVGATAPEVAHMMLDDRGVIALGKVSDTERLACLRAADVLCAPSLRGESFGMVLTEAFAAGTPVVASDIPGYRDVVRAGTDGLLVAAGDALALAQALRGMAFDEERRDAMAAAALEGSQRFAWPLVAAEVTQAYGEAIATPAPAGALAAMAVRRGLRPADLLAPVPARRLPSLETQARLPRRARALRLGRRAALVGVSAFGILFALLALNRIGIPRVVASLVTSRPDWVLVGLGLMCAAMAVRGLAWHVILRATAATAHVTRVDALQGTFIGVLMSATLPARLGEPSRALIVARRLGRARETLPVVLGTMVSQTLLNLVALAILGGVMFSSVNFLNGHHQGLIAVALAPAGALLAVLLAPALMPRAAVSRSVRLAALLARIGEVLVRVREGLRVFGQPRAALLAAGGQLSAWGLQWLSCYFLLMALGLSARVGVAGAAAVLFAVNVTAVIPATPANLGVFQAACVAVLHGAFGVPVPSGLAYGIILQAVELASALIMGMPALVTEGLSWKEVRLRAMHGGAPVELGPLGADAAA